MREGETEFFDVIDETATSAPSTSSTCSTSSAARPPARPRPARPAPRRPRPAAARCAPARRPSGPLRYRYDASRARCRSSAEARYKALLAKSARPRWAPPAASSTPAAAGPRRRRGSRLHRIPAVPLRVITAGESHGPGLTCIVEGLPAGLELDRELIDRDMARRQLGHGRGGRMKIEKDAADVTAGVRHGRTLGGPVVADGRQPRLRQLGGADEPVARRGRRARGPPAAARPRRPGRRAEVRLHRRAQRARARQRARDRGARGRRRAREGVPARARDRGRLARDPDRLGARAGARRPRARGLRRRRRLARALPGRRGLAGDGRGDQRPAQGQRVARRRLRGAGVRARARARLARLLGGAPGRADRPGDALDPGRQGLRDRRRLRPRGAPRIGRPRRDLLLRRARLLPRDQPLGRDRGRDDHRRAGRRALRDEAAADPDQAAALGRHRHARAGPGAARAHRLLHRARRRAWWGRRCSRSCSPRPAGTSSAATTSTTRARRWTPTRGASAGTAR